jgi:hypothetical protein
VDEQTKSLVTDQVKAARWFSDVFSTDAGKRALEHLRARFYLRSTTAAEDQPLDALQLAYREGMRAAVLYIADLAEFDISAATVALHEAAEADKDKRDPVAV